MRRLLFLLVCISCTQLAVAQSTSLTVVIIRHGEKNDSTGNLSCKGLHRALSLPPVLSGKFPRPSYIYVPSVSTGKSTGHARMFQTVTPFAVQQNLNINSKFAETDDSAVANYVMKKKGLVLLVWEHGNIPMIATALGVKDKHLKWDGSDFDSIWIITYAEDKSKKKLKATLTVGSEGLNPPNSCSF